jgi:pyruvate/2-oxoglutarate dehydrogenase complex dihydrolipoamide dehydrogenase (E3) component
VKRGPWKKGTRFKPSSVTCGGAGESQSSGPRSKREANKELKMSRRYDAVVIGAGPAGEVCAGELADGGMQVAIVEQELVAGECSYWACIPSKTLLRPGEAVEAARRAPGARETVKGRVDTEQALAWRDFMVADWDDSGQVGWLDSKGIELVRGNGRIDGPGRVSVDGRLLETESIVIATGSDPVIPPIPGIDRVDVWTNREATGAKTLPARLLVLGGGAVGLEIAQAYTRMGSTVTVVEGEERLLPREGRGASEAILHAFRDEGIDVRLGQFATEVGPRDGGVLVRFEDSGELHGDRLLVATGRQARLDGLGLDTVGIAAGRAGVEVDERLRAGEGVWAIGDVTGIQLFTHVGKYQARVAAADMLGREARADYRAVPRVVFTDPQVAAVGPTEEQAREHGIRVTTGTAELSGVARTATYVRNYDTLPGLLTLVADADRRVLVGAYAVGPEAGEWLGQATLAIRAEVPLRVLRDTIQPFPTFSEAFVNALQALDTQEARAA